MASLLIAHIADSNPLRFEVYRQGDLKRAPAAEVPSPYTFPVEGQPNDHLMGQLAWYLEDFLKYPFPPRTEQAARVETALEAWGRQAFDALFASGLARDWMTAAKNEKIFQVWVSADDPGVLSWPWEALNDPEAGVLAHRAQIERRLNQNLPDLPALSDQPKDRLNILLVTARPYEGDVQFRSVSRPLIELVEKAPVPAHVYLLRPPTFQRLREHLEERPHFYHVLHFDGHGSYQTNAEPSAERFGGPEGRLVFEKEDGSPDMVTAADLSDLLREQAVPAVVLNACQSAMLNAQAHDPFASVAAALLKSGTRGVVAMAYSLHVRAAQVFLPPFYRGLLETGSLTEAARRGRRELRAHPQRSRMAPEVRFRDWLVPVVYQQGEVLNLHLTACTPRRAEGTTPVLPKEAKLEPRYAFTGRDGALLELERAWRRKPAGVLIQGLAGVGKTTLAQAFVHWLRDTGGLGHGCFWFTFNDVHSAAHVFNELGRVLFGPQFALEGMTHFLEPLTEALHERPFIIVWDNFESVSGVPEGGIEPLLPPEDRAALQRFLALLRGGKTKVLITSRAEEGWLGTQNCFKLALRGLRGEEVWDYAAQVLDDLGARIDRTDAALGSLLKWLGGHPLAMQAALLQLRNQSVAQVRSDLEYNLAGMSGHEEEIHRRLYATLRVLRESLPEVLRPLLIPLGLHVKFVDVSGLMAMAQKTEATLDQSRIERLFGALSPAGLLSHRHSALYEMHSLLPSFLRTEVLSRAEAVEVDRWTRAFIKVMAYCADMWVRRPAHELRAAFIYHGANLHAAWLQGEKLSMGPEFGALTQVLATHALNERDLTLAERLYSRMAEHFVTADHEEGAAPAYHQLGIVAQERRALEAAEDWFLKALEIEERLGDERGAALTYLQLGTLAKVRHDLTAAERWYLKSLKIEQKAGDDSGMARTYHQLGMVAQERRALETAEDWYLKALQIEERLGNEHGAAATYHQLGRLAQERRALETAEDWYRKALQIEERLGNGRHAALTYHELGTIALERCALETAEDWYLKALRITERLGDEHSAALTYHQLGRLAQERHDLGTAERWCLKALKITERLGDEHTAALTYHQLGRLALVRRTLGVAEDWYLKALAIFERLGDENSAAMTYDQLGIATILQDRFTEAGRWFLKALTGFRSDPPLAQRTIQKFVDCLYSAPPNEQYELRRMWEAAGRPILPERSESDQ